MLELSEFLVWTFRLLPSCPALHLFCFFYIDVLFLSTGASALPLPPLPPLPASPSPKCAFLGEMLTYASMHAHKCIFFNSVKFFFGVFFFPFIEKLLAGGSGTHL